MRLLSIFLLILSLNTWAAPLSPTIQNEIDKLLFSLENSGCQFNRNGSWHSGPEAKKHLLKKLDYLKDKTTLKDTEQFIQLAASTSSMSGKPYQVQCGKTPAITSQEWFLQQLKTLRSHHVPPAPSVIKAPHTS
jgi:Family of unknown function (DUF5329)